MRAGKLIIPARFSFVLFKVVSFFEVENLSERQKESCQKESFQKESFGAYKG